MSKLLTPLIALALVAGSFAGFSGVASADWGEGQGNGLSLALLNRASIDLINCDDGQIAKWKKSSVTFRINNLDGQDAGTIAAIRTGILSWNSVGGPYTLIETTAATADITVNVQSKLRGGTLGWASGVCKTGAAGMVSAKIDIGAKGLGRVGLRNLAAHEAGHALGLGHSNREGDLMQDDFNIVVEGLKPVCASNLNVQALRATSEPVSVGLLGYSQPLFCQ